MVKSKHVDNFPIDNIDIDNDKYQLREGYDEKHAENLAKLIKVDGQTDAIKLWKHEDGSYQILDGFHRTKAIKEILGKKTIEAKIYEDISEETAIRISTTGNRQQLGYTDNELALLTNSEACKHSIEKTAELLGMSERSVHHNIFEARLIIGKQQENFEKLKKRINVDNLIVASKHYTLTKGRISDQAKRILIIMYNRPKTESKSEFAVIASAYSKKTICYPEKMSISELSDKLGLVDRDDKATYQFSVGRTVKQLILKGLIDRVKLGTRSHCTSKKQYEYALTQEGKDLVTKNKEEWEKAINKEDIIEKIYLDLVRSPMYFNARTVLTKKQIKKVISENFDELKDLDYQTALKLIDILRKLSLVPAYH